MVNQVRPSLKGAAIAFAFVLLGFAQASGADDAYDFGEIRSAAVISPATTNDANPVTVRSADLGLIAEVNSDVPDSIEEIVVIGRKKSRLHDPDLDLGVDPLIKKSSRFNWQLFPVYDPELAVLHIDQFQIDDQIRRAGFIEVFRIRFGVRGSSRRRSL